MDPILDNAIYPAVKEAQYEPVCIGRVEHIDKAHFDVRQFNCLVWENEQDYKQKLINRIKAVIV